jgi:hypothetical protein
MSILDKNRARGPSGTPMKRLRSPNVATIIAAAAREGRKVMSVTTRPGGVTEIQFTEGDAGDDRREAAAS